jgi:hypothetical protein
MLGYAVLHGLVCFGDPGMWTAGTMLSWPVFADSGLQPHISSQLLNKLQHAGDDPAWDDHPDLLLWLLCIGGAFSPTGTLRSEYVVLLRANSGTRFGESYRSWENLLETTKQFIWSEKAFTSPVRAIWEESLA